eukprot:gene8557-9472_t
MVQSRESQRAFGLKNWREDESLEKSSDVITTPLPEVIDAVQAEFDGGGQKLGYRSMNLKLRNEHGSFVPRKLVKELHRGNFGKIKRREQWSTSASVRLVREEIDDTVIYGSSTSNKIERWECDAFVRLWNSHRIRQQKKLQLPTGIPDHMYAFPEHYGGENKGFVVTENDLIDAADYAELINAPDDYLSVEDRARFSGFVPELSNLEFREAVAVYEYLKNNCP